MSQFKDAVTACNAPLQEKEALSESCEHEFPIEGLVRRGLYAYQLAWWLRHFPAKQLLVINHDEVGICVGRG